MLYSASLFAATLPGERTVVLRSLDPNAAAPAALLNVAGVRTLASSPRFWAIAVPAGALGDLQAKATSLGLDISVLDDAILAPGQRVDTSVAQTAPHDAGLCLLQYDGPSQPEWQRLVAATGATLVEALPPRAAVLVATPAQYAALRQLPFVRFIGAYAAAMKSAPPPRTRPDITSYVVQFADVPEAQAHIASLRATIGTVYEARVGGRLNARIQTDAATAAAFLNDSFVLGVEPYVSPQFSDERQAIALTGMSTPFGSNYLNWLALRGITPNALTNSGIIVDVADSGTDVGCPFPSIEFADLTRRKVYFNDYTGTDVRGGDNAGHGTVVAGVIAGNPLAGIGTDGTPTQGMGAAFHDSDTYGQFLYGLGVAPAIRLGTTKITTGQGGYLGSVSDWALKAVTTPCNTPQDMCGQYSSCAATVQNHSHNDYDGYGANAGVYTTNSQAFDAVVRNANPGGTPTPLAITIAAGNYRQNPTTDFTRMVMAPATAKNVITMGASESRRAAIPALCQDPTQGGDNPLLRNAADGYYVVAFCSRRGTMDDRIKPDFVAPATLAYGPQTQYNALLHFCARAMDPNSNNPDYQGASGTSFAAPVAAGAVALLRYYYSANYGLSKMSPALYKAMLVANARSLTGMPDRLMTYVMGSNATVPSWPTPAQGFGILNLDQLLSSAPKAWRDQDVTLTQWGQMSYNVTVADPAQPVRIAVAWTDPPAAAGATYTLLNDLDLWCTFPDGATYTANYMDGNGYTTAPCRIGPSCPAPFDRKNNVEVLNINPARFVVSSNRTFIVNVTAHNLNGLGVPGGSVNNQDYAIFVLNGNLQ